MKTLRVIFSTFMAIVMVIVIWTFIEYSLELVT